MLSLTPALGSLTWLHERCSGALRLRRTRRGCSTKMTRGCSANKRSARPGPLSLERTRGLLRTAGLELRRQGAGSHSAASIAECMPRLASTKPHQWRPLPAVQRRARVAIVRTVVTVLVVICATLTACSRARQYELRGQVLAVDRSRQELTVKHGDVGGFMPAMTMPFKVEDPRVLDELSPGDLVKATLVVKNSNGYLSSVERTGHEAVAAAPLPPFDPLAPGQHVP